MGRPATNGARDAAMAAAYHDGFTMQEIGDRHGVTRQRVRQILVRLGVESRHGDAALSESGRKRLKAHRQTQAAQLRLAAQYGLLDRDAERNATIVAMRKAGQGTRGIARALGLSPGMVAGVLHRKGLHRKGLCTAKSGRGHRADPAMRQAVVAEAFRTTYAAAADKYGVAVSTVAQWVRVA